MPSPGDYEQLIAERSIKLFRKVCFGLLITGTGLYVLAFIHPDPMRSKRVLALTTSYMSVVLLSLLLLRFKKLTFAINFTSISASTILTLGILDAGRTGPNVWLYALPLFFGNFHIQPRYLVFLAILEIAMAYGVSTQVYVYDPMQMPAFYVFMLIITTLSYFNIRANHQHVRALVEANTTLIETNRELDRERRRADLANQAKTLFLTTMSHELRTPLNAILGYAGILRDTMEEEEDAIEEEVRVQSLEDVASIERAGEHLLALVSNILDITQMESEHLELHPTDFSPDELLDAIASNARVSAQEKGLTIVTRPAPDISSALLLHHDRARLEKILSHLVKNAITFTQQGHVKLSTDWQETSTDENQETYMLKILIEDTGQGIPREAQEHIFDLFTQADNTHTRSIDGAGIGLFYCKRIATLMGGDLRLAKSSPEGSCFELVLPQRQPPEASS